MQDLTQIGYTILVVVAFFVIGTWFIGRRSTAKLRNRIAQDIAVRFSSTTTKVSVKLLGNTGAKFSYHQKSDSSMPKLETTIMLLDRSNIFHFLYCKARRRTDQLQIRTNLSKPASFNLELTTREEQENLEAMLKQDSVNIHELTIDNLTEPFYIVVSNLEAAESLFDKKQFYAAFEAVTPFLTRFSISRKEPQVFASVELVPQAMAPIEQFITTLAKFVQPKKKR